MNHGIGASATRDPWFCGYSRLQIIYVPHPISRNPTTLQDNLGYQLLELCGQLGGEQTVQMEKELAVFRRKTHHGKLSIEIHTGLLDDGSSPTNLYYQENR